MQGDLAVHKNVNSWIPEENRSFYSHLEGMVHPNSGGVRVHSTTWQSWHEERKVVFSMSY